MSSGTPVGLVADLWRFPVKSMGGERLGQIPLTSQGILGDRAFALLDLATDSIVSASNKRFPGLLDWQATYVKPPELHAELPAVRITTPDGQSWASDQTIIHAQLSGHFRRDVMLVRDRSPTYATKQAAFFAGVELEDVAPTATFVDLCPVSVISTGTLSELGRTRPQSRFDPRRFRMNIIVDSMQAGFVDNAWVGRELRFADQVRLQAALPDPRCSMTTLPQDDLEHDPGILRAIVEANSVPVGSGRPQPCAGVYATVTTPGVIRRGEAMSVFPA